MIVKRMLKRILSDDAIVKLKNIFNTKNNNTMLRKYKSIKKYQSDKYPEGINLIGDVKAETGLGQSMRIIAHILKQSGIPFVIIQLDSPGELQHSETEFDSYIGKQPIYSHNLIHINPNIWAENYIKFPEELLNYRYTIAYWLWELEEFPEEWHPCIQTVDEIWTPSEFISKSIRKCTSKIVKTVPYVIRTSPNQRMGREYFDLPKDDFLFLVMYDFKSISERKNPKGAIEAYKIFCNSVKQGKNNAGLVIKVNHLSGSKELTMLKDELRGVENVHFLTQNMNREEVDSLINTVDVLISLHRSEGFGLPLAEAMQMGTPVVATNWSATTEFMDNESGCLVDYKLITLNKNIGPYKKGSRWADADVEHAAYWMKMLYEDEKFYSSVCLHAMDRMDKMSKMVLDWQVFRR